MLTTTRHDPNATLTLRGGKQQSVDQELIDRYDEIIRKGRLNWTTYHHLGKLLGMGGQGRVYLSARRGTDGFTLPVAMKVFSPERYTDFREYESAMTRIASISARVALIQNDHLLDVHNFVERNRIRIMVMEWVDGYDVSQLTNPKVLRLLEGNVDADRWDYINEVIITDGQQQNRFKAGIAVAIVRECLEALAALHRENIVHGDIKPSNIMLKRSGHAKLIDMGSALDCTNPPADRSCTPVYAAPEILERDSATPRSDLASLGYVLIEMLSGSPPFRGDVSLRELLAAKRELPQRLDEILPEDVTRNELLMNFCRELIAPDPNMRFFSADDAEHVDHGAAAFHRQLVLNDMSTEYDNDIRLWLEELFHIEQRLDSDHE